MDLQVILAIRKKTEYSSTKSTIILNLEQLSLVEVNNLKLFSFPIYIYL